MKTFLLIAVLVFAFYSVDAQNPGTLDSSFGENGISITSLLKGSNFPYASGILKDDKISVLSYYTTKNSGTAALTRYLPDGQPDTTFGENSRSEIVGTSGFRCMVVQKDDKIVVAGGGNFGNLILERFKADGSPDSSFGLNGIYIEDSFFGELPVKIAQQTDGKLVVCGLKNVGIDESYYSFIARFNTNGYPDNSFGNNGQIVTSFPTEFTSLALQSDGKIICSGDGFTLLRYNPDGNVDSGFGENGKVRTRFTRFGDQVNDIAVQPDGKIIGAGYARDNADTLYPYIAVARYNTNGSLDEAFGQAGKTRITVGLYSKGRNIILQKNGKILIAGSFFGSSNEPFDICLSRLTSHGLTDSSFGVNGSTVTLIKDAGEETYNVNLQSDGKIIISSLSYKGNNEYVNILARYYGDPIKQQSPIVKKIKRWIRNHTLNWQYNADVDYFVIEQSSNEIGNFKEIAKVKAGKSESYSYTLNSLIPHNNKYYRITAINTDGSKVISDVISDEDIISIIISPNPAKNVLKISGLPVNQKAIISIINRNGEVLQSAVCNSSVYNTNVSALHSGLYNVQLNIDGQMQSLKFVKE